MKTKWVLIAICSLLAMTTVQATAAVIHVPGDQPTIQAGVDASVNGDTVLLADGIYTGADNRDVDLHGKAITVSSEHGALLCTIDCQHAGRAFIAQSGETGATVLQGLTFTQGTAVSGGGLLLSGASLTVQACRFLENDAESGGAIQVNGGGLTVKDCTFTRNRANGTYFGFGGAIDLEWSGADIERCGFYGNSADDPLEHGFGGAVNVFESGAGITDCAFVGNSANRGGAILSWAEDSVAYALVTYSTFNDNPNSNGSLYELEIGYVDAFNSIFRGPSEYTYTFLPPSYSDAGIDWFVPNPWHIIKEDPRFVRNPSPGPDGMWGTADDDYGDLHLMNSSPCIDAGSADGFDASGGPLPIPPITDLDGNPRVVGLAPDMGAYEVQDTTGPALEATVLKVGQSATRFGVTVRLKNIGDATATYIKVLAARLGGQTAMPPVPITISGSIPPGGWVDGFLGFPLSAGSHGEAVLFTVSGTFRGARIGPFAHSEWVILP